MAADGHGSWLLVDRCDPDRAWGGPLRTTASSVGAATSRPSPEPFDLPLRIGRRPGSLTCLRNVAHDGRVKDSSTRHMWQMR